MRVISAAILGPAVLLLTWLGGWAFACMLLAGLAGTIWEWGEMCRWRPLPLLPGMLYLVLATGCFWSLRYIGPIWPLLTLLVVWASDIGAYAVGRLAGGPRLAPAISPGKTWSGAAGGLAAAMVVGGCMLGFSGATLRGAAMLGIAAQLGDLGESALKRRFHVKDSGAMIPGHGGLLDRLDGLLAASVVQAAILGLRFMGYDLVD